MDYSKVYIELVSKRQRVILTEGYTEKHHIIPKSFGGSDDECNLVALTAREHFVVHRLLAKMYPNTGMVHAIWKMACADLTTRNYNVNSRTYEILRKEHARRVSEDEEARKKKSIAATGKKQSPEHIKNRTESRKKNGKNWHSDKTRDNISSSLIGKPSGDRKGKKADSIKQIEGFKKGVETRKKNESYKRTAEMNENLSKKLKGRVTRKTPITDNEKQKLSERHVEVECPHCNKKGKYVIMKRWHFDNCKTKSS